MRFVRSHRWVVVTLAFVVALVALQVPGLDSWRYHRVATWSVTPNELSQLSSQGKPLRTVSPPITVSQHAPVRVEWSATSAVRGARYGDFGESATTLGLHPFLEYSNLWVLGSFEWGLAKAWRGLGLGSAFDGFLIGQDQPANIWTGATHGRFLAVPPYDSSAARSPWRISFLTHTAAQPTITFAVSQPYGYYYLPLEDYLLVGGVLVLLVWTLVRYVGRTLRRRRAVFDDDETGNAGVV